MIDHDAETHDAPDDDCEVAVQPLEPGEAASDAAAAVPGHAIGFDPGAAVATSAPPASALTGTPDLTSGENAELTGEVTDTSDRSNTEPVSDADEEPHHIE